MADKTITGLPALPTIAKEDILLVVDNPAGTPLNRKISVENFFSNVEPIVFFSNTKGASSSEDASVVFRGGVGIKQNLIIDGNIEIRGSTVQGTTTIGAISDSLIFTEDNEFDLANTSNALRTIYVGNVSAGESGTINVYSNSTVFYSNVQFNASNLHINSTSLNVQSNTSFFSNVKIENTVDSFIVNSDNFTSTSYVLLNGNDLDINSNTTVTGNFTHSGKITLFDTDELIANSNTFVVYGNVVLGLWSSDGNPKGTTSNVYISSTNTYIKSDLTFKGTRARYFSNLYVTGQNTSITSSNTHITSDLLLTGDSKFLGNTQYNSNKFSVTGSNNYFIGKFTTTSQVLNKNTDTSSSTTTGALVVRGGVGIAKDLFVGGNLNIDSNLFLNDNVQFLGPIAEIQSNTEILGSNTYIRSNTVNIIGNSFFVTSNTHLTSDENSANTSTGALIVDGGVGIAKNTNIGGNLNVSGSIHAIGNITANGDIQLGDQTSDRISLVGRVETDIVPALNATYNLGIPSFRFANGLFKDVYTSANVSINDSLLVLGKRARFQANTEIIAPRVNSSANTTFTGNKFNIYGQNTHVTSNLTVAATNTVITSNVSITNSNVNIQTANFDLNSTDLNITSNTHLNGVYFEINSNTSIQSTMFDVASNSEFTGTTLSVVANTNFTGSTFDVASNSEFTGTTLSVVANTNFTGSTFDVSSSNTSFTGTTLSVVANTNFTGSTTHLNGVYFEINSNTSIQSTMFDVSSNTSFTGTTLSVVANTNFTGSTFDVSANSEFTGSTLNVSSNTEITGSTLNVSSNTVFTNTVYFTDNLSALSNVIISTSNTHINSNVNVIGSQLTISSDVTEIFSNTEIKGSNTHLSSNINVINTSTVITSNTLLLNTSNTNLDGSNFSVTSNIHVNNSNTVINSESLKIENGQFDISSNVFINSSNSYITNLTSNTLTVNSDLVALGNVYFGQDGAANDIIIYGKTSGEKIKYDSLLEKLIINIDMTSNLPMRVENSILMSNNQVMVFNGEFEQESIGADGNVIAEDGSRIVLEDLSKDIIESEISGLRFRSLNYVFGRGNSDVGFGSTNILILSDGNRPLDSSSLPDGQSHLYSKHENIVNSSGTVVSNGSYLHTLSADGYESVLGIHNTDGDLEVLSRNTSNNTAFRVNIFELARAIETLTSSPAGTYLKQE